MREIFRLFEFILFIWVLCSWIPALRTNGFYKALDRFFSMILQPIRNVIPPIGGNIDISPLILIFILHFIEYSLVNFSGF
ncbi:MAG: YggT family protein [Candidatus Caenarcaniphilales bacterium]|nr:YggT family protein [Candidatus Caenarcaniphilales bacterium]